MKNFEKILSRQQKPINAIYVSSYTPRRCGIATYTKDLTAAINLLNSHSLAEILVMNRPHEHLEYPWEAKFKIDDSDLSAYLSAAEYVNQSRADIVSLQHEFGLFGGEDGEYIVYFVEALKKPLVTTLHTVVEDITSKHAEIIKRIAAKSEALIVMMKDVAEKLIKYYGIPRRKIVIIPHGVPDLAFNETYRHKSKRRLQEKLILGNINLLSPQKGIEYALEAVALIAQKYPQVLYVILGQTHPDLIRSEGEKYRLFLQKTVRRLGISKNVRFINSYLPLKELTEWLKTFDIYVTPYLEPQQVTSGALAYAIGAGKSCISTPYIYAKEVLGDGRGILVPFRNAQAIADAVTYLYEHPDKKKAVEEKAYQFGRLMTWPNVAQNYLNLFRTILTSRKVTATKKQSISLPQPTA